MRDKSKPNVVVMLSRFPFPLEKGDKLRAYFQIKEMSEHFNISLICISEFQPKKEYFDELNKYCSDISVYTLPKWRSWLSCFIALFTGKPLQVAYFYTSEIRKKIDRNLVELQPDHIFCQLIRVADYVKNYHNCPKTLDYMDAFSTGMERRMSLEPFYLKWIFQLEFKRLNEYERQIYDYFEIHSIISLQDKNLMGTTPNQAVECIPNGVSIHFFEDDPENSPTHDLAFVGNLNYPPNVEAVKFVVNEILPLAASQGLHFSFLVAGAKPSKSLTQLMKKHKNFNILANPKDIRKAYRAGRIFIAPMKIGTGLQNKLLESMALGIPSITTKLANNALRAEEGKNILLAETGQDFINQIKVLQDDDKYQIISKNARIFIQENFIWKKVTEPLINAIKNV